MSDNIEVVAHSAVASSRRGASGGIPDPPRPFGKVAEACGVPRTRIERIATEKLGITGDTAVRLGRVLGTGPELWMNLQARFETESARAALGESLDSLPTLHRAA